MSKNESICDVFQHFQCKKLPQINVWRAIYSFVRNLIFVLACQTLIVFHEDHKV